MNYTIQELATLSQISVRTLRHYDEIGLLKPAFVGENKYRYYQEEQFLRLQQILFFKDLGFELKEIQSILDHVDFDMLKALQEQARMLEQRVEHLQELLQTIDKTMQHFEGVQVENTKKCIIALIMKNKDNMSKISNHINNHKKDSGQNGTR